MIYFFLIDRQLFFFLIDRQLSIRNILTCEISFKPQTGFFFSLLRVGIFSVNVRDDINAVSRAIFLSGISFQGFAEQLLQPPLRADSQKEE